MHKCINKLLFLTKTKLSSNEYCTLNRPYPKQFGTPADVDKRSTTPVSSRSRRLCRGTSKGCQNCVILNNNKPTKVY
ncbi:hypothetical protein PanWU01x14_191020 [Parasponia andersonii]|uniref:Uncharacterized protein n=1 Tax=Parasponia andersonii TaxID=3476 RepID=A0A2P5C1U8_PARAD|nr:hypothetical protein PanWU01x14_191020 [Parasponia andersonii]